MKINFHHLYMLTLLLIIFGSINWGLVGFFQINIIQTIIKNPNYRRLIYGIIGLSAIFIIMNKYIWLPFLGKSVIPCNIFQIKEPKNPTHVVNLKVKPGAKVIYWAADPISDINSHNSENNILSVNKAYGSVENSGVTIADNKGIAKLKFKYPQSYNVDGLLSIKKISPHIHYRICKRNMMIGPVMKLDL